MGRFNRGYLDFNDDGKIDAFEIDVSQQMMAGSCEEAILLTGDDTFYTGRDTLEEDLEDDLIMEGLDLGELEDMDEDERREALEDIGLDLDDYDEF